MSPYAVAMRSHAYQCHQPKGVALDCHNLRESSQLKNCQQLVNSRSGFTETAVRRKRSSERQRAIPDPAQSLFAQAVIAELQCSCCKQTKPMELFHKHQRMEKPWEAVPSQAHFCAVCVPPGAIVALNTVVPYELKRAKCQAVRSRKAFKHEFDRFGSSAEKLILEEFICSRCDEEACTLLRQLSCSICLKLLAPKCFPKGQRKPARSLGHKKPTYTCKACLGVPLTPAAKPKTPMAATSVVVRTLDCSNCDKTLSETDFPPTHRESRDPKLQEEIADDNLPNC